MKCSELRLIFLLCVFASPAKGQYGNLLFHHLKLDDGLSEQTNNYVYKDSRGFVWISSINGLNRFDGTHVKVYLPDPKDTTSIYGEIIQSNFYEDRDSGLWFCTYQAINCNDSKHDDFSHFSLSENDSEPVPGYHVFYLDSLSNLWTLVEGKGIYTFNTITKEFHFITPLKLNSIRAVVVAEPPGIVQKIFTYWPYYEGIEEIDIDQNLTIEKDSILRKGKGEKILSPVAIINEGDTVLWIAGKTELIRYHMKSNDFRSHPVEDILTMEELNDSILLVSIDDKGVWEFDKTGSKFIERHVHENENPLSLLTNKVDYISKDRDGGVWLCSAGFGLSYTYPAKKKFDLKRPVSTAESGKSKFNPNGFYEDSLGFVFCSTLNGGLYTLDRNAEIIHRWSGGDAMTDNRLSRIYSIYRDKRNNTWVSTFSGLSVIPSGTTTIKNVSDHNQIMWNGLELMDGRLIFSARSKGLYEVAKKNDKYILLRIDSLRLDKEYLLISLDSRGNIWTNVQLQRMIILDPSSFEMIAEIPIKGIISHFIEKKEDHVAWISSSTGLYKVDTRDFLIKKIYNEKDGLPCSGFNNMIIDRSGKFWLTCRNQITFFDPSTDSIKVFTEEDGLPNSQWTTSGAYCFKDGELWFASMGGIAAFHPNDLKNIDILAVPQITKLLVNDQEPATKPVCEKTNATHIPEIEKLTFSYRENTLTFIINALEYSAPKSNKVRYRMNGFDAGWLEASSGSIVRYPNLPARSFTFQVQAANSDGVFSPVLRQLFITITPPFYRTWWFNILASLATLALIIYIVYLNFSKTIELQKVRLRLYENLHDDVGSRLTAIVFSAEELIRDDKFFNPKLQHISKVAKSIVDNMRRLVWAIDPENDSMNSLVQKIRHDKSLILDDKMECHIEVDQRLLAMTVPGEIRYQISSILNEALNNISKYAQAKNVWIRLWKSENGLELGIRDDGVGFNLQEVRNDKVRSSGYGLGNMQKRVSRVNGTFAIQSKPGEGTGIEIKIPIK